MRQLLSAALVAASLVGVSAPAMADDVVIKIDLGELDIANPSDVEAINKRIQVTVARACANADPFPTALQSIADCTADGTAKAFAELEARRSLVAAN